MGGGGFGFDFLIYLPLSLYFFFFWEKSRHHAIDLQCTIILYEYTIITNKYIIHDLDIFRMNIVP